MLEMKKWAPVKGPTTRVGVVSTYPPTRCGIARFTTSLTESLYQTGGSVDVDVVRLVNDCSELPSGHPVAMEFDPASEVSIRAAAAHLNKGDLTILNHEFGIFGPGDGWAAVELAELLDTPAITIFHTILAEPSQVQATIIRELAGRTTPVVMCQAAAAILGDRYQIPTDRIEVISHGASWEPQPLNHPPRRRLITWGLLGPGKNLEQAIAAVAELDDLDPPVTYLIAGRTHPNVVRQSGYQYRNDLGQLVRDLGLEDRVEFVDRYIDDSELLEMVRQSDIVVVPYGNSDQVSSGVITEAIGAGRPIVSTRFPYSEEMVDAASGVVVDHDSSSIAHGIRTLLEDSVAYRRAARTAFQTSQELAWPNVAKRYSRLVHSLTASRATA